LYLPVCKLPGLVIDLGGEFTGGGQHKGQRVLLPASHLPALGHAAHWGITRPLLVQLVQSWDQERSCLTRTWRWEGNEANKSSNPPVSQLLLQYKRVKKESNSKVLYYFTSILKEKKYASN